MNAILSVNRTGIPWEYLPHDFPPYKTVYDCYAKWEADGTARRVHDLLRDKARHAQGRPAAPSAAVIDAQSVKTSADVAEASQGIDAGAKGFQPQKKRWVIERTFGWLMQNRCLVRDYEALPQRSRTMAHWAVLTSNVALLAVIVFFRPTATY